MGSGGSVVKGDQYATNEGGASNVVCDVAVVCERVYGMASVRRQTGGVKTRIVGLVPREI